MDDFPPNQEHFEAHEKKLETERMAYFDTLPPKTKKLLLQAEKFSKDLEDAGMRHIMWIDLKDWKDGPHFVRYNHFFSKKHTSYFTTEAKEDMMSFLCSFLSYFKDFLEKATIQSCFLHTFQENGEYVMDVLKSQNFDDFYGSKPPNEDEL